MEPIDVRSMMNAAATATAAASTTACPAGTPQRLSPAALAVVNQKVRDAYSRVVVVGAVRIADFVLLSAVGIAIYLAYVMPIDGFVWSYVWAVLGVAAAAVVSFQAAEIYDVQVFRARSGR